VSDLDLIRKASDAAPHRLYGPIATLVQDALAHAENLAGFALVPGAIKPGGTAERDINGGIALAKAVLAMPPLTGGTVRNLEVQP
jgi:hypothetical protein